MTDHVLGLDLSKAGLGQALEAMAEAWLDAQGVEGASEDATLTPMADLASRWGVTSNTVSRRLAFLGIKPIRQGNFRYLTAEQLEQAEQLHQHVLSGRRMEDFWPAPSKRAVQSASPSSGVVPASKRSDWITRGWYVAPDTAKGLKAYVNRAQEAGQKLDASEVVNEAIRQWLEAQGAVGAITPSAASSSAADGMRLSDWIDNRPVVKTTAYALMKALGIEPVKVRQAGISRPVSWLDAEMVTAMDAAVERLQAGATVAEVGRRNDSGCLFSDWIARKGCSKSTAYRMRSELGITPEKRRSGRAVDVWLTSEQETLMDAYAEALGRGLSIDDALKAVAPQGGGVAHDGMRQSRWIDAAPIGRTAAYKLIAGLGIKSAKVRLPGIGTEVAWLSPDQVAALDAAAARVVNGESVTTVCRYDLPRQGAMHA